MKLNNYTRTFRYIAIFFTVILTAKTVSTFLNNQNQITYTQELDKQTQQSKLNKEYIEKYALPYMQTEFFRKINAHEQGLATEGEVIYKFTTAKTPEPNISEEKQENYVITPQQSWNSFFQILKQRFINGLPKR